MFTPSKRKALKGVVNMSNLSITEYFIGPAGLVTNMENYAVHMNSLCYNKKDNNVYNILPPKYHDFADIFQTADKQSLPNRGPHDHAIDLEQGQQPPFGKLYSMSPAELDVLKVYLNNVVKAGIICKSILSMVSPIIFVPKSDGSLQLVIDYRRLNNITIKNRYPLPVISDMLDQLQEAKKFTKLDCKDVYNWVQIKVEMNGRLHSIYGLGFSNTSPCLLVSQMHLLCSRPLLIRHLENSWTSHVWCTWTTSWSLAKMSWTMRSMYNRYLLLYDVKIST